MRKKYSGSLKAQIVLEILKEQKTLSEISSQYGVHVSQLSKWRSQALEGLADIFEDGRRKNAAEEALRKEVEALYKEIGRLTTQIGWLKKFGIKLD